ncbi:MAG TPA: hypothetical protein DCG49_08445 [Ruminococcus sp.]|nr:hypothetical protein [Ruminococcus sp.]
MFSFCTEFPEFTGCKSPVSAYNTDKRQFQASDRTGSGRMHSMRPQNSFRFGSRKVDALAYKMRRRISGSAARLFTKRTNFCTSEMKKSDVLYKSTESQKKAIEFFCKMFVDILHKI